MDLSTLKPSGRDVKIVHPATEQEIGVTVSLLSISDPAMKKLTRKIQDERLTLERKGKGFKSADIEEHSSVLAFSAMTGWQWEKDANFKGEQPKFNRKNVLDIFEELPWFRDQVEEAISDESAFFQTSK